MLPSSPAAAAPSAPSLWVPQHHRDITLGRLDTYLAANQFSDVNLRSQLWAGRNSECVSLEVYSHPKDQPYPSYEQAIHMPYRPTRVGEQFGPSWTTHWFRVRVAVPAEWGGRGPLMFRWDSGSEAMLYRGPTPRQGLTDQRNEYVLAEVAEGGKELLFYVEMAANGMFGNGTDIQPPDENRYFTLKTAELALPHLPATALFHDLRALAGLARELPAGDATGEAALYTANKILNTYRPDDPASLDSCRALAAGVLGVRDPGQRLQVHAVGHCHIDTAWLWPFSETRRKTARSWSAQLRLTERFPWHVFTASSAQQYEWLQADYPGLFEEVRQAAGRGSFVPVGGSWVEMDTNLPGGESLVRQFLYGQRYFAAHFGALCDVFWLPDTFGYCGQLPQIARGAGIRYFLTQKLSWNNINTFPHSTFLWEGLDGSQLLTHFPPANTYNAQADAHDLLLTASASKDKDRAPAAYMLYGNGDGGGGPTPDMCESLARLAGCRGVASAGVVAPGEFFRRLEAGARDLLTWRGELYFELHRGTYTSHAANKADNRGCEVLLREAEAAGAAAAAALGEGGEGGYTYPRSELDAIWKDVLLFQFHDVLPGSAIERVYQVTAQRYPQMLQSLTRIRDEALAALIAAAPPPPPPPPPPHSSSTSATSTATATASAISTAPTTHLPSQGHTRSYPSNPLSLGIADVAGARLLVVDSAASTPTAAAAAAAAAPGNRLSSVQPAPTSTAAAAGTAAAGTAAATAPVAWVFNSLSFPRLEVMEVPAELLLLRTAGGGGGGGANVRQRTSDGTAALVVVKAPPLSLTPVWAEEVEAGATAAAAEELAAGLGAAGSCSDAHGAAAAAAEVEVEGGLRRLNLQAAAAAPEKKAASSPHGRKDDPWVAGGGGGATCYRTTRAALSRGGAGGAAQHPGGSAGAGEGFVYVMQNNMVRAVFDEGGRLVSLYDLGWQRELVPEGQPGNVFRMYEDIPLFWDAWDIEIYHLEKGRPAGHGMPPPQLSIQESGPLRCSLLLELPLSPTSRLRQTVSMTAVSRRLDFHAHIFWQESRTALKVEFPLLLAASEATYEVQYGAVRRPTHTNTSWDWARFEVVAHKWADLGEPGYGVALLNDCKYGHATHGNVMRLTLLRSPKAPDAHTDLGEHRMRFALLPHAADWGAAGVAAHGWAFNAPLRLVAAGQQPSQRQQQAQQRRQAAAALRGYNPSQPMFTVTPARPSPLHSGLSPAASSGLSAPPLILDTLKLPEPPLEQLHRHPGGPVGQEQGTTAGVRHTLSMQPPQPQRPQALIVRLYEPHGARGVARLRWAGWLRVSHVTRCDLLERDTQEVEGREGRGVAGLVGGGGAEGAGAGVPGGSGGGSSSSRGDAGGSVDVSYEPFQIITLKLYLQQD
ncbi:hypothetical protein Agub_g3352 [Astrephomene gubernaculifera]|uniref:alpha-mannosidase n=1 Tax=Astrephomene gubernaculifera TaxID=47775 RepID=A0AAD3DII4_9CHLO|nr:hypothetical protein Agub_g3352 [Astrephomene gubernaculifera]